MKVSRAMKVFGVNEGFGLMKVSRMKVFGVNEGVWVIEGSGVDEGV